MKLWFRSLDDKLINAAWSFGFRKLVIPDNMSKGRVLPRRVLLVDSLEQKIDDAKSRLAINLIGNII